MRRRSTFTPRFAIASTALLAAFSARTAFAQTAIAPSAETPPGPTLPPAPAESPVAPSAPLAPAAPAAPAAPVVTAPAAPITPVAAPVTTVVTPVVYPPAPPTATDPALAERARQVRAACRDIHRTDYYLYTTTAGTIVIGGALVVVNLFSQQNTAIVGGYTLGLGSSLLLGGLAIPFGRGIFKSREPLTLACERMLTGFPGTNHDDAYDVEITERLLLTYAIRPRLTVWALFGLASVAVTVGSVIGLTTTNRDLANLAGSLAGGMIVAWASMFPTPNQQAARRYAAGGYRDHSHPRRPPIALNAVGPAATADGLGLAVAGTFE